MKILLSGATAGTNFGDFLFARMFQDYVGNIVGKENVYWYDGGYHAMSDFYAKHLNYDRKYKLSEIDALVYISGGYLCGNDTCFRDYIIRFLNYFLIGIQCWLRNIPFVFVAVEAAKSRSKVIDFVQRFLLKKAQMVIVRNHPSYEYVTRIDGLDSKKVYCTADSVFSMDRTLFGSQKIPDEIEQCQSPILFYHTKPLLADCTKHFELIIPIINKFVHEHPEYSIIVSPDQYSENYDIVKTKLSEKIKTSKVIFYDYENPVSLCKVIEKSDVVVTDKLHVGIVGAQLGKSVISFSGHTQKIARLYNQLGIADRTVPISDLTIEKGVELLNRKHQEKISVPDDIRNAAKSNFAMLSEFIDSI